MRAWLRPAPILGVLVALALATAVALYLVPSNDFIFLPDRGHPVAPLVQVQGGHDPKGPGGIYFLDVLERRASIFESIFPSIHRGSSILPAREVVPPGISDKAERQADLRAMTVSQRIAGAVALKQLGYKVVIKPSGVIVSALTTESHAVGKLHAGDVIVAADGVSTPTISAFRAQLVHLKPGDSIRLTFKRGDTGETKTVTVKTIADGKRTIIGFTPEQAADIQLPLKVSIDAGNVGGPSAGLAFALEVMEELGRNVDRGYRVAVTGALDLDGNVIPIGGVKQKTYGAREAQADVMLVPAGDNAQEARRYADGLRIIPVKTFPQALRALATLPSKG
jgi:PDZ domain-containing protein